MPDLQVANAAKNAVTVAEAKTQLDDLLAKVYRGEEWSIVDDDGQIIALLKPVPKRWKAFGMMKGQIKVGPDFDEPLDDFKPYVE